MFFLRILCFFLIPYSVFSQNGNIKGKVTLDNREPAIGVYISLTTSGKTYETTSDFNGLFTFSNIPYGDYKAKFLSLNSKPKTVDISINGALKNLTVTLEFADNKLDEVSVITKTEKTKKETKGFVVNIIETKQASIRNIQTNELLNTTVGVKLRQNGGLGANVEYSLNGLSGKSISIFIDGIPISVYGSSFSLNSIPPSMIENIEVYKGVVPGHLADDALGGAINIVLKKGAKTNLNASVSYGSFNTFQASVNSIYRYKNSGFTIKASGFHNYSDNDYKISGKTIVDKGLGGVQTLITARRFNDAYRSTGGMLQFGYTDVKWADQFLVGITGSDDYKEIQHGAFVNTTPYKGRFLESDALLTNLTYIKKDFLTKGLDVNINGLIGKRNRVVNDTTAIAYSWTGEKAIDYKGDEFEYIWGSQNENGPTLLNIKRNVASLRSGVSYQINKKHKVLLNHVYSSVDREDSDEMISLLENTFQQTSDLYKNIFSLSYEMSAFKNKFKTNIFGKHYRQKVLNTAPEWNDEETEIINQIYNSNKNYNGYGLAASYIILPNITVLASTEKAIRLPSETEVFGDLGDNTIANLTIKPEISHNYNLGFRFGNFYIKKHSLVLSTNLFSRNIKDLIGFDIDGWENDELVQYANFDEKSTSKGIEAQINYSFNNNFGFNFNFSKLSLKTKNTAGLTVDVPNTPLFIINTSLRYSFKNVFQKNTRLNLFYNAYFTDEFSYIVPQGTNTIGQEKFLIPKQFIQDLGCSYTFPNQNFVLSFDAKNIFNQAAYDNLSVQKPGRAFYLKLNYSINKF